MPSIKELRAICQATAPAPGSESLLGLFSRRFSIYGTWVFIKTPVTPNQITVISTLTFFAGIAMFFWSERAMWFAGAGLVFLSIIFDGCDGEKARFIKNTRKSGGAYVEPVSHDIQYGISFFLLGIALWVHTGNPFFIILGSATSIAKLLYRFLEIRFWHAFIAPVMTKEKIEEQKYAYQKQPLRIRAFYWVNKNVFSSSGWVGPLFIGVLVGRLDLVLWFYGAGYAFFFSVLFARQVWKVSSQHL